MKIRKIEWHQVSSYYETEIDEDLLSEIYPDMDADDISQLYARIVADEVDIETVIDDAGWDVPIEWDHKDDDWWTHRKGGYDVTYERIDEPVSDEETVSDPTEEDIIQELEELSAMFKNLPEEDQKELMEKVKKGLEDQ